MASELDTVKPCPFCGESLTHHSPSRGDDHYQHARNDCVLATTGMGDPLIVFDDAERIAAWNRRPPPGPEWSHADEALSVLSRAAFDEFAATRGLSPGFNARESAWDAWNEAARRAAMKDKGHDN